MSIKSDRWIRRMAAAQGMIEPFSAEQVRLADGQKIVSYGTSSYGYDVRCAEEFKIFTNINSTIVDPKAFDEKSFVDFKGPVCIIPPNSFALARTVEFFRIPRSVLTVCLGKSTYARCFRADTRVALVDGTAPTLEQMARRHAQGEVFFGYSLGQNGRVVASRLDAPRFIGRDSLLEIELDDGALIHATPDHQFMRRDGRMVAAHDLRAADALMPLYRDAVQGYETVYQPIAGCVESTRLLLEERRLRGETLAQRRTGPRDAAHARRAAPCAYRNHSVAAVREIAGDHDVFCKATSPWNSRTPRRCRRRFTPMRVWRKCCSSSPTKSARRPTRIVAESIKASAASLCRRLKFLSFSAAVF